MNDETDLFEKVKELEKLVISHENILHVLAGVLVMAGYVKDTEKSNEDKAKRNEEDTRRFEAMQMIIMHGGHDGEHHKEWCLDQVFRILAGNQYQSIVDDQKRAGYDWKEGIAP